MPDKDETATPRDDSPRRSPGAWAGKVTGSENINDPVPDYMTLRALVKNMDPELRNLLARAIVAENAAKTVEFDRSGKPFLWNRVFHAIDNAERADNEQCVHCEGLVTPGCLSFDNGLTYCGPRCRDQHKRDADGE